MEDRSTLYLYAYSNNGRLMIAFTLLLYRSLTQRKIVVCSFVMLNFVIDVQDEYIKACYH